MNGNDFRAPKDKINSFSFQTTRASLTVAARKPGFHFRSGVEQKQQKQVHLGISSCE